MDEGNNRVFNQAHIKEMVVAYFQNLLGCADGNLEAISEVELRGLLTYRCPQEISDKLICIPTEEEIKEVLFAMPKNKAPGPDGYSAEFFWEAWEVVGKDSVEAIREFFTGGRLLRQFNTTTISHIPKEIVRIVLINFAQYPYAQQCTRLWLDYLRGN